MTASDPRLTLARPDLADAGLEGIVAADRYVRRAPMRFTVHFDPTAVANAESVMRASEINSAQILDARDRAADEGIHASHGGRRGKNVSGLCTPTLTVFLLNKLDTQLNRSFPEDIEEAQR